MVQVIKKEQETSAAVVRRFTQRVQASGVLKRARSIKFFKKEDNRNMRRAAALESQKKRIKKMRLIKLGKAAYKK